MMQGGCEVACDIMGGACEHSGKTDLQPGPTRLPDTDQKEIFGWYSGIEKSVGDGNECVGCFERVTLVKRIGMNVVQWCLCRLKSENSQRRGQQAAVAQASQK